MDCHGCSLGLLECKRVREINQAVGDPENCFSAEAWCVFGARIQAGWYKGEDGRKLGKLNEHEI